MQLYKKGDKEDFELKFKKHMKHSLDREFSKISSMNKSLNWCVWFCMNCPPAASSVINLYLRYLNSWLVPSQKWRVEEERRVWMCREQQQNQAFPDTNRLPQSPFGLCWRMQPKWKLKGTLSTERKTFAQPSGVITGLCWSSEASTLKWWRQWKDLDMRCLHSHLNRRLHWETHKWIATTT